MNADRHGVPRIVRTSDVCFGKPRIEGTRWPTETVIGWYFDAEAIQQAYPWLQPDQIDAAIRYESGWRRVLGRFVHVQRVRLARMIAGDDWGDDP